MCVCVCVCARKSACAGVHELGVWVCWWAGMYWNCTLVCLCLWLCVWILCTQIVHTVVNLPILAPQWMKISHMDQMTQQCLWISKYPMCVCVCVCVYICVGNLVS